MCRPPLNKAHIGLFIKACNKIQDNIHFLESYEEKTIEKKHEKSR